ncbi:MAG: hypothetical protein GY749_18665 [Desulfobacteraceae bacterium]|nr:hypothetical protein [Desulfobacteraceae bacterium]
MGSGTDVSGVLQSLAGGSPDTPVTDLPVIDLKLVSGNRYEVVYTSFMTPGNYNIAVFATDKRGHLSLPKKTSVTKSEGNLTGDINGNGTITLMDAVTVLKALAEMNIS